jgi:hypothetical protein
MVREKMRTPTSSGAETVRRKNTRKNSEKPFYFVLHFPGVCAIMHRVYF